MARQPKPWYRKDRDAWFVTIDGTRHNLGSVKKQAFDRFYDLMREPKIAKVTSQSFAVIADSFLDWLTKNRATETFGWYQYRLERFCQTYPDLLAVDIRPYHVQKWVDSYDYLSQTSRRNYIRSVKARFISQIMTGGSNVRQADDIGGQELSYAEVKAIASGNPAVLTLAEADAEVQRLDTSQHATFTRESRATSLPQWHEEDYRILWRTHSGNRTGIKALQATA